MTDELRLYIPFGEGSITKRADGKLVVKGVATDESLDSQNDVVDYQATKEAYERTYKSRHSIREMHQGTSASGVATQVDFDDIAKSVTVTSLIVDPVAIAKVEEGVYKGYSIGGQVRSTRKEMAKVAGVDKEVRRITKYDWLETSLVDQGANPSANALTIVKAAAPVDDDEDDKKKKDEDDDKKKFPFGAKKVEEADIIAALAKMTPEARAALLSKAEAPIDRVIVEAMIEAATAPLMAKIEELSAANGGALTKIDLTTLAKVDVVSAIDARLKKIEAEPASTGPAKGIYAMTKGETGAEDLAKAKDADKELLEKMAKTNDPYERERISQERALLAMKHPGV